MIVAGIRKKRFEQRGIGSCCMFCIDEDSVFDATEKKRRNPFVKERKREREECYIVYERERVFCFCFHAFGVLFFPLAIEVAVH